MQRKKSLNTSIRLFLCTPSNHRNGCFSSIPNNKAAECAILVYAKTKARGNYFVGIDNYVSLFGDASFIHSLKITAIYIIVTVVLRFVIGLLAALLMNQSFRGRGFGAHWIPWAIQSGCLPHLNNV